MSDYVTERRARSASTLLLLGGLAALLALLTLAVDLHPGFSLVAVLCALPTLYDIGRDHRAGLTLTDRSLSWFSGSRRAELPLDQIARVRMNTSLDFASRVTVETRDGGRLRIPREAYLSASALEAELRARGIKVA